MSGTEIKPGDFADWDWGIVSLAGHQFFGDVYELIYHHYDAADGWTPFAKPGDVPALITETRDYLDRIETVIKKARADIAGVERNARLAAGRRERAEKKAEEDR